MLNKSDPPEKKERNWIERLKDRFLVEQNKSFRATLEHLLKRKKGSDETITLPEHTMLRNVLRFGALRVEDVMVPRADIIAIDEQSSLEDLLCLFEKAGHSRIPVYRETLDDPVGMVHIKDLMGWITGQSSTTPRPVSLTNRLRETNSDTASQNTDDDPTDEETDQALTELSIAKEPDNETAKCKRNKEQIDLVAADISIPVSATRITRNVLFVPPSMSVIDLLLRMQTTRVHLALVVDEYGGTDGLVSIEDLVEEIVGEIEDEHDVNGAPLLKDHPTQGLIADARTPIEELEEVLKLDLALPDKDEDDVDTLGGLVFSLGGRVPVRGELVRHPAGIEFEVLDADPRRIKALKIHASKRNKTSKKEKTEKT